MSNRDFKKLISGRYVCSHCGAVHTEKSLENHLWLIHRDDYLSNCFTRISDYIDRISTNFVIRNSLSVEAEDVGQYLRINLFLLLSEKYVPADKINRNGDLNIDRFSKSALRIFLKRYITRYYYKHNKVHNTPSFPDPSIRSNGETYSVVNDDFSEGQEHFTILDHRVLDPSEGIYHDQVVSKIRSLLSTAELSIFEFVVDPSERFTQKQIAEILGVSQPAISYHLKAIRQKALLVVLESK